MKLNRRNLFASLRAASPLIFLPISRVFPQENNQPKTFAEELANYPLSFGCVRQLANGTLENTDEVWTWEQKVFVELYLDLTRGGASLLPRGNNFNSNPNPFRFILIENEQSISELELVVEKSNKALRAHTNINPQTSGLNRVIAQIWNGHAYVRYCAFSYTVRNSDDPPYYGPVPDYRLYQKPVVAKGIRIPNGLDSSSYPFVPVGATASARPNEIIGIYLPLSDIAPRDLNSGPLVFRTVLYAGDQVFGEWQRTVYSNIRSIETIALFQYFDLRYQPVERRNYGLAQIALELKNGKTFIEVTVLPVFIGL